MKFLSLEREVINKRMIIQPIVLILNIFLSVLLAYADDVEMGVKAYDKGDFKTAYQIFSKAAENNIALAQTSLGLMYYKGQGVQKDYKEAVKWYRRAAEQGYARAQSNLGTMYAKGEGVQRDDREAEKWFRLAAEQGYAAGQANLGLFYVLNRGVQGYKEAIKWFRLAAEQGDADGQYFLAVMFKMGTGVLQDYKEAAKWFRLAVEQGNAKAKCPLAELYAEGEGVEKDISMAKKLTKEGFAAGETYCQQVQVKYNLASTTTAQMENSVKTFETTSRIYSIAFSPDSSVLAAGLKNGNIILWNVSEGSTIKKFEGHTDSIETVEFSSDGNILVSSGLKGNVIFWDTSTGNRIKSFQCRSKMGQTNSLLRSALSPDGKLLAALFPAEPNVYELTIWDTSKQEPLTTIKRWGLHWFFFSPDSKRLITVTDGIEDNGKKILIWDTGNWEKVASFYGDWPSALSPSGHILATPMTTGLARVVLSYETKNVSSAEERAAIKKKFNSETDEVILYDISTGKEIKRIAASVGRTGILKFSTDEQTLIALSPGYIGNVWDVTTGAHIEKYRLSDWSRGNAHALNTNGRLLASSSCSSDIYIECKDTLKVGDWRPIGLAQEKKVEAVAKAEEERKKKEEINRVWDFKNNKSGVAWIAIYKIAPNMFKERPEVTGVVYGMQFYSPNKDKFEWIRVQGQIFCGMPAWERNRSNGHVLDRIDICYDEKRQAYETITPHFPERWGYYWYEVIPVSDDFVDELICKNILQKIKKGDFRGSRELTKQ